MDQCLPPGQMDKPSKRGRKILVNPSVRSQRSKTVINQLQLLE